MRSLHRARVPVLPGASLGSLTYQSLNAPVLMAENVWVDGIRQGSSLEQYFSLFTNSGSKSSFPPAGTNRQCHGHALCQHCSLRSSISAMVDNTEITSLQTQKAQFFVVVGVFLPPITQLEQLLFLSLRM